MSSKAREIEKRKERRLEEEQRYADRREREAYFADLVAKLNDLDIDPYKLKEYLDYI